MKKGIQSILLTLVFSIAAAARLSILGWLFAIGVGSILIIGITHFIIHFYSMNSLAIKGKMNSLKIALSHLLFLCIFLFQSDFDDSRSYFVIEHVFGIENSFLGDIGFPIVIVSSIGYIILSIIIIRNAKKEKIKGKKIKYIIPSVLISISLPFILISGLYAGKDLQQTKALEETGEYNSINRALKKPNSVTSLQINPFLTSLSSFPTEILTLSKLKVIDFNEQKITRIPDDINKLENLEILNLLDNNIKEINPSICNCNKLIELRIGGDIKSIPDCLKTMKSLKHLSIQSKHSNELLDELRSFKNIKTAHFYLKSEKVDFSSMTEEETKKHFKSSKKFDNEKWGRIKSETGIKHKY